MARAIQHRPHGCDLGFGDGDVPALKKFLQFLGYRRGVSRRVGALLRWRGKRDRHKLGTGDGPALVVFCVQLLAAAVLIFALNRHQWFRYDEWEVLFKRSFGHPSTLVRNWNGHPVAFATVAYQALYRIVGLHHYWPYQLLTIVGHLGVAIGLRTLLRRMAVNPWLANASLAVLLVYGASQEVLAWGFSSVYTVSLALGLAQILLVDHGDQIDRRDILALVAGTAAVWAGPPGPVLVAVGLVVAVVRRGLRPGLLQVVALIPFAGWVAFAPENSAGIKLRTATPGRAVSYGGRLVIDSVEGLGRFPLLSVGLGLAAATGAILMLLPMFTPNWRQQPLAPVAVTLAAVATAILIGVTRAAPTLLAPDPAIAARYLYLVAALLIPAIALCLDRLARTSNLAMVIAIAALLVPLPRSIGDVGPSNEIILGFRSSTLVWAEVANQVPVQGDYQPNPYFSPGLTMSSLGEARRRGKVPDPPAGQDDLRATTTLTLALKAADPNLSAESCRRSSLLVPLRLDRGDLLRVGPAEVKLAQNVQGRSRGEFGLPADSRWHVHWGPIEVIRAGGGPSELLVCRK